MKTLKFAFAAVVMTAIGAYAGAQEAAHLEIKTVVQKEEISIDAAGNRQTRLVDADTVLPGDEVVYVVSFANVSQDAAEDVVITNPLPKELTYVEGSAFGPGADVEFSVDGGQSFAAAGELSVAENGAERPARNDDYTHIRWVMASDIEPGAQGMAQFRARLN